MNEKPEDREFWEKWAEERQPHRQKSTEPPVVDRMDARISALQRRLNHLHQRSGQRSSSSEEWDRLEIQALEVAIQCMRYVEAVTK